MRWNHFSTLGSLVFAAANAVAGAGQGLRVDDADQLGWPRWQARLQVFTEPVTRGVTSFDGGSLRPRSAALFGDYYMTGAYLGQAGGIRLTGGLLTGTRGTVIAPGLATPQGLFGIGTAQTGLGPMPFGVINETQTWPYLGIGYSESSPRGGWGFSADFGLAAQQFSLAARSLGNRSLDGAVREMRLTPVLQLGLAYRF